MEELMFRSAPYVALLSAAAASAAQARRLEAQVAPHPNYLSAEAGFAVEPPQFSVRSRLGFGIAADVGRVLSSHDAVEVRLGAEVFGAPTQFIIPGGCLGLGPCNPPQPSQVWVPTLASDLVFFGDRRATTPIAIVGAGLRYITEAPAHSPELRPFGEIGAGVAHPFGAATLSLEARWQVAASSGGLPRWTMPVGINMRFF
jgi:hypothetical protein